jgi:hypothetical protein
MKYILFLFLIISVQSFAQIDSSKTKVSITLAAKDCEYIANAFEKTNKYEDVDSVAKKRFRVASPPTNNANVQIDSVEGRVLVDVFEKLCYDVVALNDTNNVTKRFFTALLVTGNTWIAQKANKIKANISDAYDFKRVLGRDYLRKNQ